MNKYSSLFSQMPALFPRLEFEKLIRQTGAEYDARGFSSWGHDDCDFDEPSGIWSGHNLGHL